MRLYITQQQTVIIQLIIHYAIHYLKRQENDLKVGR